MADIELIVKIPRKVYKAICDKNALGCDIGDIKNIIRNGTPLPKGHGDLIDRNSILCPDLHCNLCGHTDECFKLLAPTIIEADKEQEDGKIIDDENKMELIKNAKDISYIGKSFCDGFKEGLKEQ